jgi:hypothetical protein
MATSRWNSLRREIGVLRKHFLPEPFDPLGNYPQAARVHAYTRAFLVLSHAEIESYLEDWAKEIARACEGVWTTSNRVTEPLTFMLSTLAERILVPETLSGPNAKDSHQRLTEASVKLFQRYYKRIKDNHGIKEKNVLSLFAPLGIPASALGTTLLPNLESLGALRGQHAHQSRKAVQMVLDPETEHKKISDIVTELQTLDQWLAKYKRRIR